MSILDALRLQRSEQNSVRDLAMLPQAQIVQLAQSGQIPAEVVPIIISEKARMAQQAAQIQAAQQPQAPTVIEQAMAQNAQAETPMTGVASIPTQIFQPQNYATGGIVAFQGGGLSDPFFERTEETPEYTAPEVAPTRSSIDDYIREAAARRAEARKPTESMLALERALVAPGRTEELRREAQNMALLQAGLGILSGTSPYALQNIGRGAAPAAEAYGRQMADIRRQEREGIAQRAGLDVKKQEQALADIAAGEAAYSASRKEALEERKIAAAMEREEERTRRAESLAAKRNEALVRSMAGPRTTDRETRVQDYVNAMKEQGDKRPEALLRAEAQQQIDLISLRADPVAAKIRSDAVLKAAETVETLRRQVVLPADIQASLDAAKRRGVSTEQFWTDYQDRLTADLERRVVSSLGGIGLPRPQAATQTTPARTQEPTRLRFNPTTGAFE